MRGKQTFIENHQTYGCPLCDCGCELTPLSPRVLLNMESNDKKTKTQISLCEHCYESLSDSDYSAILSAIHDSWEQGFLKAQYSEEEKGKYRERFMNFEIVGFEKMGSVV